MTKDSKPEQADNPELEFVESINEKKESLRPKLVALYQSQIKRDDILEKGYNEQFYSIEYGYNLKYNEINKEISKIVLEGTPIPEYWKKAIENSKFFHLNEKDKEILKYLRNIELSNDPTDKKSFTVYFHFDENQYFDGKVLEKTYIFNKKEDSYTTYKSSEIKWKGEAPNIKIVKKKIKKGKTTSTITKEKKVESFFNIFNKKEDEENDDEDEDDEKPEDDLSGEAEFVLNDLVPFSMEYYLDIQKLSSFDDGADCCDDEEDEEDDPKSKKSKK